MTTQRRRKTDPRFARINRRSYLAGPNGRVQVFRSQAEAREAARLIRGIAIPLAQTFGTNRVIGSRWIVMALRRCGR